MVVLYIFIGFITWVLVTREILSHDGDWDIDDGTDLVLATMMGLLAGMIWPVSLAGMLVMRIVKRIVK